MEWMRSPRRVSGSGLEWRKRRVLREVEETTDGEAGLPSAPSGICLGNQSSVANHFWYYCFGGLPRWLRGKDLACNVGDMGLMSRVRTIPWRRTHFTSHPCWESHDRGAWWAMAHVVTKSDSS